LIDGYFRDAGSICRHICGSVFFFLSLSLSFSFSFVCYRVSRAAVVKTKRKKRRGRHCSCSWQNADKSVWSPRRGRRLWKSRETGTRAREAGTRRKDGPPPRLLQKLQLSVPGSDTRRQHCLLAALLTMVAVITQVS